MMTSNKPWQAIVNADNLPKVITTENNLSIAKQNTATHQTASSYSYKLVTPKRYSFDDNGGGYEGL